MSYISNSSETADNKKKETDATPFYNKTVLDHFTNPRNIGEMTDDEADGYGVVGSASCGDQVQVWIKVESGKIADIKFKCFGCPGAISTGSMMTVLAQGKTLEEAKALTDNDVVTALGGLPEQKVHCSLMGIKALHAAVKVYEQKATTRLTSFCRK
jgi:nitrogen fixation NifU-like protein